MLRQKIKIFLTPFCEATPACLLVMVQGNIWLATMGHLHKALETGFTKFSIMARDIVSLIQDSKKLRDDLIIYYFTHSESITDGEDIISYKIKTSGKAIDSQIII